MFNDAIMMEIILMKARKYLVVWRREKRCICKKTEDGEQVYFSKLQYRIASKLITRVRVVRCDSKVVYIGPSAKMTSWKGNDMLEKVD